MKRSRLRGIETPWLMVAITGIFFGLVAAFVDLKPVVDENFFFSSSDPQFRQTKKIDARFPAQPQLLLNISFAEYFFATLPEPDRQTYSQDSRD